MSNLRAFQKPATVKSWFARSISWSLSLYGAWLLLLILFQQLGPTEQTENAAIVALTMCLLGAQAASWRLAVYGLDWVFKQDEKAGFWLRGAAALWQVLFSVFQVLLLLGLLAFIAVLTGGMPMQD